MLKTFDDAVNEAKQVEEERQEFLRKFNEEQLAKIRAAESSRSSKEMWPVLWKCI